jgi:hypothetical protein
VPSRSTLERLAPLTGVAFVVLFIAAFVISGETPDVDDPVDEVRAYWVDNDAENIWSAAFVLWGSVLAIWFGASLRTALRRAEGEPGRLSGLVFAGWTVFAVGALAFAGFGFAAADVADEADVGDEVIQTLSILNSDFFPIVSGGLAVAMLASGIAVLRHGAIPRWLGYVALLLGITAVTPIGFFSFLVAGVWVLIVSVLLYQGEGAPTAGPTAPPPPPPPAAGP